MWLNQKRNYNGDYRQKQLGIAEILQRGKRIQIFKHMNM